MFLDAKTMRTVSAILDSPSDDFVELGKIAGLDPATAYVGADLAGVDFGEDDLAGFNFSGADLSRSNLSRAANFDKIIFSSETTLTDTILPDGVTAADLLQPKD